MAAKRLGDIALNKAGLAQQAALMRLQLYFTGATHQVYLDFLDTVRAALLGAASKDGSLDGLGLHTVNQTIEQAWGQSFSAWKHLFQTLRREAASIPFGVTALYHNRLVAPAVQGLSESRQFGEAIYRTVDFVFEPQLQDVMDAADRHVYADGMQTSQRIWRYDQDSLAGVKRVVSNGVANKQSAWDMAKDLEPYLGVGQDCPRWTATRLGKLTKKDIASDDRRGLLSDDACAGKGVAYNALRLARNEIQIVHHLASDAQMARQPWVEKERIELSPDHPTLDICDDVASGGEKGDGVYPKGEISLPLHPQCLCFKTAVLMDQKAFTGQLRGWMRGETSWPEMDAYAAAIGGRDALSSPIGGVVVAALESWLYDSVDDLVDRMGLVAG